MKRLSVLIFLSVIFSSQSYAQDWGTVFRTDPEMAKMDVTYADQKIFVQNLYYPRPEKFKVVLELRMEASKLLKKKCFSAGQILVTRQTMDRASGKQGEIAHVEWQAEYKNLSALKSEINSFTAEQAVSKRNSRQDEVTY